MSRHHDHQPGFWSEYQPPATAVAELVQRPIAHISADALMAAYFKDADLIRRARR
ncbi:hypothetical protein [Rhizobium leucaenae]|uniref:hypothetical protein n=1 Tax=Rhizobium leucaenae TaxID=29450 RepID=UPI000A670BD1|nr:hypothetical protein [Rhizobium leucaenae]